MDHAPSAPLIELLEVTKTFRMGDVDMRVLHGVSLEVARGELIAIMGASGSGKSTLMNILGCLDRPTSGSYRLDGRDVGKLSVNALAEIRNQTIGFVFQSFNLLPRTSAVENVELPLLYGGVPAKERKRRAEAALVRVGLTDRMGHHPNQMSGGQQQRVAIARAVAAEPKLILADEPTGNLDSQTSLEIMQLFQSLWRAGMTLVMVTHEHDIAQYATRVIVMKDGRIVSDAQQNPQIAASENAVEAAP